MKYNTALSLAVWVSSLGLNVASDWWLVTSDWWLVAGLAPAAGHYVFSVYV